MRFSIVLKQRIALGIMSIVTVITAHLVYINKHPEWILFRKAENEYQNKQWAEAAQLYQESLDKGLKNSLAISRIGHSYGELKDFPKAVYWYKHYVDLNPKDIWARKELAGWLTANGEFDKAAEEYSRIIQLEKQQNDETK